MAQSTYLFLDESGNLDFSRSGTSYFVLTSVSMRRPFRLSELLEAYKYDCLEFGLNVEYFHCAQDNSHVRGRVFDLIAANLEDLRIDSLVVEKCKTNPKLREDRHFYPEMLGYLLKFMLPKEIDAGAREVVIITDAIPLRKKRQAIEKAIQQALAEMVPDHVKYRILHHASQSHYGLQVADYCCWAVFRKWQRRELKYYSRIKPAIRSEFDIFKSGDMPYY